jgi:hypothetical protein
MKDFISEFFALWRSLQISGFLFRSVNPAFVEGEMIAKVATG